MRGGSRQLVMGRVGDGEDFRKTFGMRRLVRGMLSSSKQTSGRGACCSPVCDRNRLAG